MSIIITAGLLLGATGADSHRVAIDHRGQRVDVTYRSNLNVTHKQVGTAGPGGRASTLRCAWKATVSVNRAARSAAGHVLTRSIASEPSINGSRPGWCAAQKNAIAHEVAARSSAVRQHLLAMAGQDREALALELDAAHPPARS